MKYAVELELMRPSDQNAAQYRAKSVQTTKAMSNQRDALVARPGWAVALNSAEDLAQLLSKCRGCGVAIAGVLDQPLELLLELVVVHAVGAAFEVQLHL